LAGADQLVDPRHPLPAMHTPSVSWPGEPMARSRGCDAQSPPPCNALDARHTSMSEILKDPVIHIHLAVSHRNTHVVAVYDSDTVIGI
jgi:hypothetical protein